MQPIQKFSDFQSKKTETAHAIKEADLQKEYGEVFASLLKKYNVTSPAELDDTKKKEFFNEIGNHYTAGEGQTDKGEELVKKEGGEAPVKEEEGEGEEEKEEEEIIGNIASSVGEEEEKEEEKPAEEAPAHAEPDADNAGGPSDHDADNAEEDKEEDKEEKEEVEEDAAEEIETEVVAAGEPEAAEGDVEKQPEEVEAAAEVEEDPEAGKAAEAAPDEDTAKEIEAEEIEAGKPEKVVLDFDSFVKKMAVNEAYLNEGLDADVAKAILKMVANKDFDGNIYMSLNDRDALKKMVPGKRLTGAPGPEKGVRFTTILNALGKGEFYTDGSDLVKGDKTVVNLKDIKKYGDLKKYVGGF